MYTISGKVGKTIKVNDEIEITITQIVDNNVLFEVACQGEILKIEEELYRLDKKIVWH